jgi:hypothetical protein
MRNRAAGNVHSPASTPPHCRGLLQVMKIIAGILLLLVSLAAPVVAADSTVTVAKPTAVSRTAEHKTAEPKTAEHKPTKWPTVVLHGREYKPKNRPVVEFKGGVEHMTPYPQSKRSTSVWASDSCFRGCNSSCAWKNEYCVRNTAADVCRVPLDNCTRACQRECRGFSAGPLGGPIVGLIDFY